MTFHPARELRQFRTALAAAPAPTLSWDPLGLRSHLHRLGWLLLHEHTNPRELGWSVFVGTLIGASPFFGLHVVLVLTVCFAFGLNKLAAWVATNISFPLISPLLIFSEIQLGQHVLTGQWAGFSIHAARAATGLDLTAAWALVMKWFSAWFVGALIVGGGLGALFGLITWWLARRRQP